MPYLVPGAGDDCLRHRGPPRHRSIRADAGGAVRIGVMPTWHETASRGSVPDRRPVAIFPEHRSSTSDLPDLPQAFTATRPYRSSTVAGGHFHVHPAGGGNRG